MQDPSYIRQLDQEFNERETRREEARARLHHWRTEEAPLRALEGIIQQLDAPMSNIDRIKYARMIAVEALKNKEKSHA